MSMTAGTPHKNKTKNRKDVQAAQVTTRVNKYQTRLELSGKLRTNNTVFSCLLTLFTHKTDAVIYYKTQHHINSFITCIKHCINNWLDFMKLHCPFLFSIFIIIFCNVFHKVLTLCERSVFCYTVRLLVGEILKRFTQIVDKVKQSQILAHLQTTLKPNSNRKLPALTTAM